VNTVVITGAGRGIGLELAAQLLRRGDRVFATYRQDEAKGRLEALGRDAADRLVACRLDVRESTAPQVLLDALDGAAVDVLINNAGIMGPAAQATGSMDYDAWMDVFAVNVMAPHRLISALLPLLRRSPRPRVITLSSIMGCLNRKNSGYHAYRSSKAALNKVTQLLATELRADGVVVCPVHPGWVKTDMGGAGAVLTVEDSARGIIALIDGLTLARSGRFLQWDGTELPW
jgi:NAD(P)-dependent dehydrogenase (short-subunit alcohol dehydrogenase family)